MLGEVIIELDNGKRNSTDNLDKCKGKSGVWALIGRNNEEDNWICLNVGINKDIGTEISLDIEYMSIKNKIINKDYINRFGELIFSYNDYEYDHYRSEIYKDIKEKYSKLRFICIGWCIDDNNKRRNVEDHFAWMTRAKYWKNGGSFQNVPKKGKYDFDEIEAKHVVDNNLKQKLQKIIEKYEIQRG